MRDCKSQAVRAQVPKHNERVSLEAHVSHIRATTCGRLSIVFSILAAYLLDLAVVQYSAYVTSDSPPGDGGDMKT